MLIQSPILQLLLSDHLQNRFLHHEENIMWLSTSLANASFVLEPTVEGQDDDPNQQAQESGRSSKHLFFLLSLKIVIILLYRRSK